MSVFMFSKILPPIPFDGGYVQATMGLKGTWRISAWMERHTKSGNVFHTRAATRVRRSEEAASKAAAEMAKFWSRSNPDFADRAPRVPGHHATCHCEDCGNPLSVTG